MKAIRVHEHGGPEVLKYEEVPAPDPGPGEAVIRAEAIGVNFIDVYHRTGLYPIAPPLTPGMEGAGTVEAVGPDVDDIQVGDRVAYAMTPGSYSELPLVPSWKLVRLPENMDSRSGAAIMLQGLTAHYLTHSTYPLKAGDTALIHAAAGGVGLLLIQMAKKIGATIYGTVSTEEKAAQARAAGADEVIMYTEQNFETEVQRLTGGKGVHVVYDSVGQATFDSGLNCLRPRGIMVAFGQASGLIPPFNLGALAAKGSLYITRPTLASYAATREDLLSRTKDLFAWHASGDLKLRIEHTFPLSDAAEAHRQLEGRKTTGKVLLIP